MVTSAPGTRAPEESVTTPRIRDVVVCARSADTARAATNRERNIYTPFDLWGYYRPNGWMGARSQEPGGAASPRWSQEPGGAAFRRAGVRSREARLRRAGVRSREARLAALE